MDKDRNARIERRFDSVAKLCAAIEAAPTLGFRDITVTTIKRQDATGSVTFYVLDLAEHIEPRRRTTVTNGGNSMSDLMTDLFNSDRAVSLPDSASS